MSTLDVFISYAGEDLDVASELRTGLTRNSINVWLAKVSLRVGDSVLTSINQALNQSRFGVLVITDAYMSKPWTIYETQILVRDYIIDKKRLLPVWHDVSESQIHEWQPALTDVFAAKTSDGMETVIRQLLESVVEGSRALGVAPSWEDPFHRFFEGRGELLIDIPRADGRPQRPAATLWEALVHLHDDQYPMYAGGSLYTKSDLLRQAALAYEGAQEVARRTVGDVGIQSIWRSLVAADWDPGFLEDLGWSGFD